MADTTLAMLRETLSSLSLDALLVPHGDEHCNEYLPAAHERLGWLCGFTGSAGTALVSTAGHALLWTDGRYYVQARQQLLPGWELMEAHATPAPHTWIGRNLINQDDSARRPRVGVAAATASHAWVTRLRAAAIEVVPLKDNPVDDLWGHARPAPQHNPIVPLGIAYAGADVPHKLDAVDAAMASRSVSAVLVTALDEVAWLINARGSDIPYNPVFSAAAVVLSQPAAQTLTDALAAADPQPSVPLPESGATLRAVVFAPGPLSDPAYAAELDAAGVVLVSQPGPGPVVALLQLLESDAVGCVAGKLGPLWLDARTVTLAYTSEVAATPRSETAPLNELKSIKNAVELDGMRACHVRDGVALTQFFAELDTRMASGDSLTETEAADMLQARRAAQDAYVSLSFETISSSGPNGAIIHYAPPKLGSRSLAVDEPYLVDSGAQYLDGTTDVTRVRTFGPASDHVARCYTRVLQGHIALASAVFPEGTTGHALDVLARTPLWRDGLNYLHGTGHGVGSYLNVHEGPHLIAARIAPNNPPLKAGMTVTIEPGYYEDGAFGIRIENVMLIVDAATPHSFDGKAYLAFEPVTFAPLNRALINSALLSPDELLWINAYHAQVIDTLSPHLAHDTATLEWLHAACAPIA